MDRGRGTLPSLVALTATVAAAVSLATVALAATGDPDQNFNGGHPVFVTGPSGSSTGLTGVAKQSNGRIVVVGNTATGSAEDWLIERYLTNGKLDSSFGNGGVVKLNLGSLSSASAVLVQPADQKIVVGGEAGTSGVEFVRLNTNGTLDKSFGSTGEVTLSRSGLNVFGTGGMARDGAGNIYLAGSGDTNPGFQNVGLIASVTSAGSPRGWGSGGIVIPDTSSAGPSAGFTGVAASGSTVFFAGAIVTNSHAQYGLMGAVSTSSGHLVSSFGSGGLFKLGVNTSLNGVLLGSDGKLKVTGFGVGSGPGTGALIASFKTSGTNPTDTAFGHHGSVIVGGKANQPNNGNAITQSGKDLMAATTAVLSGGKTAPALVAVDEKTGALDMSLGKAGFRIYNVGSNAFATGVADPPGDVIFTGNADATGGKRKGVIRAVHRSESVNENGEPDFRIRLRHVESEIKPTRIGKAGGKPVFMAMREVRFKVTNDGKAPGEAMLEFRAGKQASFEPRLTGTKLFPDSTPSIHLGNDRKPMSKNCHLRYELGQGKTVHAECFLVTLIHRLPAGKTKFLIQVRPLDSPTDTNRDNDTATDNRQEATVRVLR